MKTIAKRGTAIVITEDQFQEYLLRFFLQNLAVEHIVGYRPTELSVQTVLEIDPDFCIINLSGANAMTLGTQLRAVGCFFPLLLITDDADVPSHGVNGVIQNVKFLGSQFAPVDFVHTLESLLNGAPNHNGMQHQHRNGTNNGIQQGPQQVGPSCEVIFFKIGDDFKAIPVKDINYFYADNKITYARVGDRNYPTNVKLKSIEESFQHIFVRIHKTYLVNISAIDALKTRDNALVIGAELLPIGSSFKKELMNRLIVLK
jgi:hypothetical protein